MGSESEVIEAWNVYEILDVIWILVFSSFYLQVFILFGCLFGFWIFRFYFNYCVLDYGIYYEI